MIDNNKDFFEELNKITSKEKKTNKEIISLLRNLEKVKSAEERKIIASQITALKNSLKKTNEDIPKTLDKISLVKPLYSQEQKPKIQEKKTEKKPIIKKSISKGMKISKLEKNVLKRLKEKQEKIIEEKIKKPSKYVKTANNFFSDFSKSLFEKRMFKTLKRDIVKAGLQFIPSSYLSMVLFTTFLSIFGGIIIFLFFLFFNLGPELPIITLVKESFQIRFLKVFWILFVVPVGTFLVMYFYPSMEKNFIGNHINQELPFATIHMASISNSMVEPSKIFNIILSTKDYPYLERELIKLMNEINIYGSNLVGALRSVAFNSPSVRLTELFNSLATTINSGGDLPKFFEKRAESLLFEYRLEREKYTKFAETFMDIYISVVIAAPMILMLLVIMMKISGLGISMSSVMITLVMVLGVSILNIVFLTFLHLKQPGE